MTESPVRWTQSTILALLSLFLVWAFLFGSTWARWGNVTIDSGREVYVPSALLSGKTLYKDVWYPYGPLAPYLNSLLFRLFGERLETVYWAGSLAALGSAIFLLMAAMRLGAWIPGWAAGGSVLLQAFAPSLFCFPFPYSFAAVYGFLACCALLWAAIHAVQEQGGRWLFLAACLAAIALLLKTEYGAAAYGLLVLLLAVRAFQRGSRSGLALDAALIVPGLAIVALVLRWMVGLRGLDFLLQENWMSWPTSYFMRQYGLGWIRLAMMGRPNETSLELAVEMGAYCGAWTAVSLCCNNARQKNWAGMGVFGFISVVIVTAYAAVAGGRPVTSEGFYLAIVPRFAPLLIAPAIAFILLVWILGRPRRAYILHRLLAAIFALVLCARLLEGVLPVGYAIYYSGPLIACMIAGLAWVITPREGAREKSMLRAQAVISALFVLVAARSLYPLYHPAPPLSEILQTPRGTIRLSPGKALGYRRALQYIAERSSSGGRVMSLPEDVTLYFLSGTEAPTRVYLTTPGANAPGKMTREFLEEMERSGVTDILWSNRTFPEYGVPRFGADFDRPIGDYIREHFTLAGRIPESAAPEEWQAEIWRRK